MSSLVERMPQTADIGKILRELKELERSNYWGLIDDYRHAFAYNSRNGSTTDGATPFMGDESVFKPLNIYSGTYIEEVIKTFPCDKGRVRFLKLRPPTIMSFHRDPGVRYHLPIETDECCGFLCSDNKIYKMPADGHFYRLDATCLHTAFNASKKRERIHLVIVERYW